MIRGIGFASDSPLEEDGIELVVPHSKRIAVPSSPFGFRGGCTGRERSNLRNRYDFQLPAPRANVVIRAT
jgi:hypothetical protein